MRRLLLLLFFATFLLSSCREMAEAIFETTIETLAEKPVSDASSKLEKKVSKKWKHMEQNYMESLDWKRRQKEQIAMQKEGKCPVCKGIGRSADGNYICSQCDGTGNYDKQK